MTASILCVAALTLGIDVEVRSLSGEQVDGILTAIDAASVAYRRADTGDELSARFTELMSVTPKDAPAVNAAGTTIWINLEDGSQLNATSYLVADGAAEIKLTGGETVKLPTRAIQTVRLKPADDEPAKKFGLSKQWSEILGSELAGDTIVVRRKTEEDGMATVYSLDYFEGVVGDVADERIKFDFDGDIINVAREKVEGVYYYHAEADLPAAVCAVRDSGGSVFNAKQIALAEDGVSLITATGAQHKIPFAQLHALDFSLGKLMFLSDMTPDRVHWSPFLQSSTTGDSLTQLYTPRKDQTFSGKPLKLNGHSTPFRKGLAIHSRTDLAYRVPTGFRRFEAIAGIDAELRDQGHVQLIITGDGKPLFDAAIAGSDPPKAIDLDIEGVRRLTILVDFGENLDIADHLLLGNARITK
jgi:hypothetical protein